MFQFPLRALVSLVLCLMTVVAPLSGSSTAAALDSAGDVTTPVIVDPAPALPPSTPIGIPAPPIPFYGTALYVLFGQVVQTEGNYYIVEHTSSAEVRSWITGPAIFLSSLTGKQVGAIAGRESLPDGSTRFRVIEAIVLTDDLSERISTGDILMYVAPRGQITVKLRGRMLYMDQPPILGNGRTLVGLRAIAEAMGAHVTWEGATGTATVRLGKREVIVRVGSSQVIVRQEGQVDRIIQNDIAPVIMNGRTMVPARVLAEGFGLNVTWTVETRTVDLN